MTSKVFIGLDRDGVINTDLGDYCTHPRDFEPIPGSLEAIANLRHKGYGIVIITNQGGISKGRMSHDDVENVHMHMLDLLGKVGCTDIDGIYYSESSDKKDLFAKPNTGMFKRSQSDIPELKWRNGFYVGDKMTDLKAAMKIGARPVLVRTGYGEQTEQDLNKYTYKSIKQRSYVFDSLQDFAENL